MPTFVGALPAVIVCCLQGWLDDEDEDGYSDEDGSDDFYEVRAAGLGTLCNLVKLLYEVIMCTEACTRESR
jgi:hypothetical protein